MDTIPLPVVMDGATGTELMARGMPQGVSTEQWVLEHPEVLLEVQRAYVRSGSQVLLAPTFGATRVGLSRCGAFHQVAAYNRRLAELTRLDDRVSAIMNVYRREAGCGFTFPGFSGTMQANTGR